MKNWHVLAQLTLFIVEMQFPEPLLHKNIIATKNTCYNPSFFSTTTIFWQMQATHQVFLHTKCQNSKLNQFKATYETNKHQKLTADKKSSDFYIEISMKIQFFLKRKKNEIQ